MNTPRSTAGPDLDVAERFVTALTGAPETACTWQVFDESARKDHLKAANRHGTLKEVAPWLAAKSEEGCGIFVCVNETDLKGRKKANVTKVRAFFIDKDKGKLPAWHLPPSIIVQSVRGAHAYWLVNDGDGALKNFGDAQKALASYYDSDVSVSDLPRVMRVPGFLHRKGAPQKVVRVEADGQRLYGFADVLRGLTVPSRTAGRARSEKRRPFEGLNSDFQPGRHGDWRKIDLPGLFKAAGLYRRDLGQGKHAVVCPWGAEHTDANTDLDSSDTSTVIWAAENGGKPGFNCLHSHCVSAGRKLPHVLDVLRHDVGAAQHNADMRQGTAASATASQAGPATSQARPIDWPVSFTTKDGEIRPSKVHLENTAALLTAYGIQVRHDLMRHRMKIVVPWLNVAPEREENAALSTAIDLAERHGLSERYTLRHLPLLATEYHPAGSWVRSKPWDGTDRVSPLLASVKLRPGADAALAELLLRRWLVGCVCAAVHDKELFPAFKPQGVLTLQGAQAQGKTSWLLALAPKGSGWIAEGLDLDPHDRDSVQRLTGYWIAELGEVDATFKKADLAALKAFIIRDIDVYRTAYERREERVPRRTMLAATVNRPDFLVDPTGNRRFWTVPVESLDFNHGLDMQQVWAQVLDITIKGERWWLDQGEQQRLAVSNSAYEVPNPLRDEVDDAFRILAATSPKSSWMSLADIAGTLPSFSGRSPTAQDLTALARVLVGMGAERGPSKGHTASGNKWPVAPRTPAGVQPSTAALNTPGTQSGSPFSTKKP
jgi:hypothetical protein